MPFGLYVAGCPFQRMMDMILGDLPYFFVYVDDILIASPNAESHLLHVCSVLDQLRLHSLSLTQRSVCLLLPRLSVLGYMSPAQAAYL